MPIIIISKADCRAPTALKLQQLSVYQLPVALSKLFHPWPQAHHLIFILPCPSHCCFPTQCNFLSSVPSGFPSCWFITLSNQTSASLTQNKTKTKNHLQPHCSTGNPSSLCGHSGVMPLFAPAANSVHVQDMAAEEYSSGRGLSCAWLSHNNCSSTINLL